MEQRYAVKLFTTLILLFLFSYCLALSAYGGQEQNVSGKDAKTFLKENKANPVVSDNSQVSVKGAQFTGVYLVSAADSNKDKKYDFISAKAEVGVIKEGEYGIYGSLLFKDIEITSSPFYRSEAASYFYLSSKPGIKTITLNFSGQAIYEAKKNGIYTVWLRMIDKSGMCIDKISFETPYFRYTDFREVY